MLPIIISPPLTDSAQQTALLREQDEPDVQPWLRVMDASARAMHACLSHTSKRVHLPVEEGCTMVALQVGVTPVVVCLVLSAIDVRAC